MLIIYYIIILPMALQEIIGSNRPVYCFTFISCALSYFFSYLFYLYLVYSGGIAKLFYDLF